MPAASSDPRARLRDAKDAVYRHAVLDAAEAIFADQGYEAARVQEIAAQAGVSLATLYKLYPGKAELRQAVHELRAGEILLASTHDLPQPPDAVDLLGLLIHGVVAYVRYQLDHPAYLRLTLREGTTWTTRHGMTLPEQLDAWNQGYGLAVETFKAGMADGTFVDEPPEQQARLMIAILQVVLGEWVEQGMHTPKDEVIRRATDQIVRAFATDPVRRRWFASARS